MLQTCLCLHIYFGLRSFSVAASLRNIYTHQTKPKFSTFIRMVWCDLLSISSWNSYKFLFSLSLLFLHLLKSTEFRHLNRHLLNVCSLPFLSFIGRRKKKRLLKEIDKYFLLNRSVRYCLCVFVRIFKMFGLTWATR